MPARTMPAAPGNDGKPRPGRPDGKCCGTASRIGTARRLGGERIGQSEARCGSRGAIHPPSRIPRFKRGVELGDALDDVIGKRVEHRACSDTGDQDEQRKVQRHGPLRGHRRSRHRGQRRGDARTAPARQGRARDREDDAGGGGRTRPRPAADRVAHQVHDQGPAGTVRVRRGGAAAGFAARRRPGPRHRQLHRARQAVGGVRGRIAAGAADRRDRQGGHRVPERSPAGARSHGVLRLRDEGNGARPHPPHRDHHQQQREGAARRVSAAVLLPLHPVPRRRHHARDRRRTPSEAEEAASRARPAGVLRPARGAGAQEEAVDLGAARLDQAAGCRGHPPRGSAHRPGRSAQPPRGQGVGPARVPRLRRFHRVRHPELQGGAAPPAAVRARRGRRGARSGRHHPLHRAQRRVAGRAQGIGPDVRTTLRSARCR